MEIWDRGMNEPGHLYVRQYGHEICEGGHQFGPAVRDHFLIHFVASGCGVLWSECGRFEVQAGQGFIIFPDQVTTYRADDAQPWTYAWTGYAGYDAQPLTAQVGLTRESPVFDCPNTAAVFAMIYAMVEDAPMRLASLAALGNLYRMLAMIGQHLQHPGSDIHREYYQRALWFMEGNYSRPIQVTEVADFVGLSRSQLFRVFQQTAGVSPKACLQSIRLRHAQGLLSATNLSMEEIATSVGISSPARLGVLFRERFGMTLGQYRKQKGE